MKLSKSATRALMQSAMLPAFIKAYGDPGIPPEEEAKLQAEYKLIKEKKSTLSRKDRLIITTYIEAKEKIKND